MNFNLKFMSPQKMNECNLCKLPRDIRFSIMSYLNLSELSNFCRVNRDCQKMCQDENFWTRKLQRDYPDFHWKTFQYESWLKLYKRLTLGHGRLHEFKAESSPAGGVDFFYKKIIGNPRSRPTYAIDDNSNLRMLLTGTDDSHFDMYLKRTFDLNRDNIRDYDFDLDDDDMFTEINVIIFKNIKDLVVDRVSGLLLTVVGNVYEPGDVKQDIPEEIARHDIRVRDERLIKIAKNVKEVGTSTKYSYYVTADKGLYVRNNGQNYTDRKKAKFKFVSLVRAVHIDDDNFYYANLENNCFKNFGVEPILNDKHNIKKMLVNGRIWYFIHENGSLSYFDFDTNQVSTISGQYYNIFCRLTGRNQTIVYVVATDLSLYQLNHQKNKATRTQIADNVLSVSHDYYISLPLFEYYI